MAEYKSRGKGSDLGHWLETWSASPLCVDRKSSCLKTLHVPRPAVSIIGGIQPRVLKEAVAREHMQDRLCARLLLAMPPGEPETPVQYAAGVTPEEQQRISQIMTSGHISAGLNPPHVEQGIHDGIDFERSLTWPYPSQSTLKPMLTSPAHDRHFIEHPPEDKDCWRFGRICHHGKLEPLEALRRYTVMPDFAQQVMEEDPTVKKPKATNRYRELVAHFEEVNGDKEIVEAEWYQRLCGIVDALKAYGFWGLLTLERGRNLLDLATASPAGLNDSGGVIDTRRVW